MVVQDDAALLHRPAAQVAATLDRLVVLGVQRVRLTANWSTLAPDADRTAAPKGFDAADPAAYEQARWAGLDTAVSLARARGLRVLLDIGFWAPVWATTDAAGPRARSNIDAGHYADFAVAVTRRYGGTFSPPVHVGPAPPPAPDDALLDGPFGPTGGGVSGLGGAPADAAPAPAPGSAPPLPAIDQVALWNEPNHQALFLPQWRTATAPSSPEVYRRMVLAAYPAIKAVRPRLRVLIGNTSSTGGVPGTGEGPVPPLRFLRQLACVDRRLMPITTGACSSFTTLPGDGWAHHPYTAGQSPDHRSGPGRPDDVRIADLRRLATLLDTLADRGRISEAVRRIHLTEFGYETRDIGRRKGLTERRQAHWLTWAEQRASQVPNVVAVAQFLLRDQLPAPTRVSDSKARPFGQFYTGLLDGEGRDKLAVRSFTAGLFAERRSDGRVRLWVRLRGGAGQRTVAVQRRTRFGRWRRVMTTPTSRRTPSRAFETRARTVTTRVTVQPGKAPWVYRLLVSGGAVSVKGLPTRVEAVTDR